MIGVGIINGELAPEYTLLVCVRTTITLSGNKHSMQYLKVCHKLFVLL